MFFRMVPLKILSMPSKQNQLFISIVMIYLIKSDRNYSLGSKGNSGNKYLDISKCFSSPEPKANGELIQAVQKETQTLHYIQ